MRSIPREEKVHSPHGQVLQQRVLPPGSKSIRMKQQAKSYIGSPERILHKALKTEQSVSSIKDNQMIGYATPISHDQNKVR